MNTAERDLTLLIMTYERPDFLLRELRFWANESVRILVLDGSKEPVAKDLLSSIPVEIEYHHSPTPYYDRIQQALTLIRTPYMSFLCDDEFYLPQAMYDCIDFLKTNSDYVSAIGRCVGFKMNPDLQGRIAYENVKVRDIRSDDPGERMNLHFLPYAPTTYYSVLRTDVWRKAVAVAFRSRYTCVYTAELLFELSISLQGKSKILQTLHWLRSKENDVISSDDWNRRLEFREWFVDAKYADEVEKFMDESSQSMAMISGMAMEEARSLLSDAINHYLMDRPAEWPIRIERVLKRLRMRIKRWKPFSDILDDLIGDKVHVYYEDLARMLTAVEEFHSKRQI